MKDNDPSEDEELADALHAAPSDLELGAISTLIDIVRIVVGSIAIAIWSVVGFLFWIPMLVFAMVQFSALVVYATIKDIDPDSLGSRLERAVRFYLQGFRNVIRAIINRRGTTNPQEIEIDFSALAVHCAWTVLFWVVVVIIIFGFPRVPESLEDLYYLGDLWRSKDHLD